MDFRFTPEQEALRREVREFLEQELPPDHPEPHIVPETGTDEEWQFALDFSKKLAKRRWYTASWPKRYGGLGFGPIESLVLSEELLSHGVSTVNSIGMLVASLLMRYGTEEQRHTFLPPIANCEVIWGEGYSEPDAGSDLASLGTLALRDGDHYVLNGTKIWTGSGHRSHWMFVFSRTDPSAPKHRGLSYLLVDMTSPGVTVAPLPNLAGIVTFNQEFFENVSVPAENLVGEENAGWQQRSAIRAGGGAVGPDSPAKMRRDLGRLIAYCKETTAEGARLIDNPLVRQKLARLATDVQVATLLSWRMASLQARGGMNVAAGEASGILNRETHQRLARAGVEVLGLYGGLLAESPRARLHGWFPMSYMFTVASTIYGGTVEIHRNILANRGLGLPRA